MLRYLLVEAAQRMLTRSAADSDLKRWGLKLMERGGKSARKRAVVAVARKLSVLLLRLWVTGEVYEPRNRSAPLRFTAEIRLEGSPVQRRRKDGVVIAHVRRDPAGFGELEAPWTVPRQKPFWTETGRPPLPC